jgi:hypothetical protein
MAEVTAVTRSSQGLVDALFSAIDRLNAKEIDPEECRALSHTARTIVGVARLELDFRRFTSEGGRAALKSLTIDNAADKK